MRCKKAFMVRPELVSAFDEIAASYAGWYDPTTPRGYALRVRQERVLELLDQPNGKILDIGCGPGILVRQLLLTGHEVWGVDASPGMIEECHKRFGPSERAHFSVAEATNLTFPDGFFDAAVCTGVIDFIEPYAPALRAMARAAKPHGTLIVSFPNLFSPAGLWTRFVFYPPVRLLRPMFFSLAGRATPPAVLSSFARLYTARSAIRLMSRCGGEATDIVYYYYDVLLSPLDQLFPAWMAKVAARLEPLRFGKLRWLGGGFLIRAKKLA